MIRYLLVLLIAFLSHIAAFAADSDFPPKPNPPRLVNDFAGMMTADEVARLEAKLLEYEKTSSTQITVITLTNLGGYEVSQYAVELGTRWGVGRKGKDNGVVILASKEDRKINISTGYGLEGALTDIMCGRIIRNEIVPQFKNGNFYGGFDKAADAVIAATKGEYKAEEDYHHKREKLPAIAVIFIIIGIIILAYIFGRGGGGNGGGGYMSGRGFSDVATGMLLGQLLGGGGRSRGGSWGGGGSSGGGFGGFGGGSFGGGGASGSW